MRQSTAEKKAFLEKHPRVTVDVFASLEKLEGSGIEGTADWAFWEDEEQKREECRYDRASCNFGRFWHRHVPLLLLGVNPRSWRGFLATIRNCRPSNLQIGLTLR